MVLGADKKWHVSKVNLEHNHLFSPSKGRFYRCHRVVNRRVKRQLEIHQRAGVRMNKSFNTLVVQNGGTKIYHLRKKIVVTMLIKLNG